LTKMTDDSTSTTMSSEEQEGEHYHDQNLTTSTRERWEYIATVLSTIVIVSLVGLVLGASWGVLSLSAIPRTWMTLYSVVVLMATTWTFGKETLEAVKEVRK
jgi:hypothetical protein